MRKISVLVISFSVVACALAAVAFAGGGHTVVKKSATVPPFAGPDPVHAGAKAKCPSGMRPEALGVSTRTQEDVGVIGQRLSDSRTARAALNSFKSDAVKVTSIAYCDKQAVTAKVRSKTATVGDSTLNDQPASITASCKDDEHVMFGGFKQPEGDDDLYLAGQYRSGQGWTTEIYNFEGPRKVTSYAYCSKDAPTLSTVGVSTSVPGGAKSVQKPACPSGKHVVSGGYKATVTNSDAFVLLRALQREGSKTWKVVTHNDNNNDAGDLTAFAYCAKD